MKDKKEAEPEEVEDWAACLLHSPLLASPRILTFYIPTTFIQDNLALICVLADGPEDTHLPPLGVNARTLMIFLRRARAGVRGFLEATRSFLFLLPILTQA